VRADGTTPPAVHAADVATAIRREPAQKKAGAAGDGRDITLGEDAAFTAGDRPLV